MYTGRGAPDIWRWVIHIITAITIVVLLWPFTVMGQGHCYPAEVLENYLRGKHQEVQITTALSNSIPATIIEVWVSLEGTWTVVERDHHRRLCMIRAGQNWRSVTMERGQPL